MLRTYTNIVAAKRAYDRRPDAAHVRCIASGADMARRSELPEEATERFLASLAREERTRRAILDEDEE